MAEKCRKNGVQESETLRNGPKHEKSVEQTGASPTSHSPAESHNRKEEYTSGLLSL
jgi:hypothetical protein